VQRHKTHNKGVPGRERANSMVAAGGAIIGQQTGRQAGRQAGRQVGLLYCTPSLCDTEGRGRLLRTLASPSTRTR
jgi:hypothetical protein